MLEISKEMSNILEVRMMKHMEDDIGIQICWDRMVQVLSQNERETIEYLEGCSETELYWVSEVFEDISGNLNSYQFIECLRGLDKKYPKLSLTKDIDVAEDYIK